MSQQPDWIEKRQSLRTKAEGVLSGVAAANPQTLPSEVLMHELLVHKVELEMQVEELRRAHTEMEEARDRYLDLYEFAPVGYLSINRDGLISEVNLTGAALFGVERSKLINRRFAKFISLQDQDRWHRSFMSSMDRINNEKRVFDIEMNRADGSTFLARVVCQRRSSVNSMPLMHVAVIEMNKFNSAAELQN